MKGLGLTVAILLNATLAAAAPQTLEQQLGVRGWALIIGVSRYVHAEPLRYAASDARAFSEFLLSPRGGGLPPGRVITLLEEDASRFRILAELERLQDEVGPEDMVFVFLAGHGYITKRGIGYFIPSDGNVNLPSPTSIPFSSLKELVEIGLAHVKHRVLVTDLCHSGRIGPERSQLAAQIQNLINQELLKIEPEGSNFLNLLGSRPTEPSWERDDLGGGVFSHVLLEGLNGKAVAQGTEVKAQPLVDFVMQEVPRYTSNQQHPMVNREFDPDLTLAKLDLPGPRPPADEPAVVLILTGAREAGISRIEWDDPATTARSLLNLEAVKAETRLPGLLPGRMVIEAFGAGDTAGAPVARIELELVPGETRLDLSAAASDGGWSRRRAGLVSPGIPGRHAFSAAASFRTGGNWASLAALTGGAPTPLQRPSPGPQRIAQSFSAGVPSLPAALASASLGASAVAAAQTAAFSPATGVSTGPATLLLRPQPGTQVVLDGALAGVTPSGGYVQLPGLSPGTHRLHLVSDHQREHRFRVELTPGLQFLDWRTGQLQPRLQATRPPDQLPLPAELDPGLAADYRRVLGALWSENLVGASNSALQLFRELEERLPSHQAASLRRELAAAMGQRAQRIILRYIAGGDIRWVPEIFEEGVELVRSFQELVESTPFLESQERFFLGRALIERGRFPEAVAALQEAISLDPDAAHAYNALGLALWRQNRLPEAVSPLSRAMELAPNWTYPRNTLALVRLELRDYDEAAALLRGSLELRPGDSVAWHGLGQLHLLFGRWDEAESELRQAIEANPGNAYAHHTLGLLMLRTLRLREAEELLRLAIRLEPDEPSFHVSLAGLLRQAGRQTEADAVFQDLLQEHPEDPSRRLAWAEHLAQTGRGELARQTALEAAGMASGQTPVLIRAGLLWLETDPQRARDLFRKALDAEPDNPYAHYNLAVLAAGRGQVREALNRLEWALRTDPRYPAAHLLRGKVLEAAGETMQAETNYAEALRFAVEPELRQEAEQRLQGLRNVILDQQLREVERLLQRRRAPEAWGILARLWAGGVSSLPLRDLSLQAAFQYPDAADTTLLPFGTFREALESPFWASAVRAEQLHGQGRREEGSVMFRRALEDLDRRSPLLLTSFCLRNRRFSPHELVLTWMERTLDENRPEEAKGLVELAMERKLFAVVPNLSPLTLDRLMVPDGEPFPNEFADFDVELHPDSRLHQVLARMWARLAGPGRASEYLGALPDAGDLQLRLRIAQEAVRGGFEAAAIDWLRSSLGEAAAEPAESAAMFWLLAELEQRQGQVEAAIRTLTRAASLFPRDGRFQRRLRELGERR
jgi:tetratricopeptide (TPR) repeat protein/uncharacterized caspase-like protein